ncbi:protein of unknown function [Legionella micdadei]|uniref:Transposase n=1 Tax=Legionella micdadei TaxID=451 RepID=A0A098GCE8_LEGMI|nr:protein of unknown function [Legionella micdadei]
MNQAILTHSLNLRYWGSFPTKRGIVLGALAVNLGTQIRTATK